MRVPSESNMRLSIGRIVSGGQTGPDRAALDFALVHHIRYGGWCPRRGWAEDLRTPPGLLARYPCLKETPSDDVDQRTVWNIRDSDATLVLTQKLGRSASRGTDLTEQWAAELARPFALLDVLDLVDARMICERLLGELPPGGTLNIAGPRESEAPGIYARSRRLLDQLLLHVVCAVETEVAQRGELGLDAVEPAGVVRKWRMPRLEQVEDVSGADRARADAEGVGRQRR
jgi:putative molybdenum carrier protein